MTIKKLKEILNSTNTFDNAEFKVEIQDGEWIDHYIFREVTVDWGKGGVPRVNIVGTPKEDTYMEIGSKYAETNATAWGSDYYGFTKEGVWDIDNGEYNCYGEKEE